MEPDRVGPSKLIYRHAALTNGERKDGKKRFELLLTPLQLSASQPPSHPVSHLQLV